MLFPLKVKIIAQYKNKVVIRFLGMHKDMTLYKKVFKQRVLKGMYQVIPM